MAGFLNGLFQTKASGFGSSDDGQAVSRAVAMSPSSRSMMYASGGSWDTEKAMRDGYEKVLFVFRCVDVIAANQAPLPMYVRRGDEATGTIAQSPQIVKLLNQRPNSYESASQFRYRLSSLMLLSRKGVFIEVVGNPENPESLHIIPPQSCEPIPDPLKFVSGYRIRDAQYRETTLPPEQVIWIRAKPDPVDPYAAVTPLSHGAGIAAETDFLARLFNRNFLQNDGRPGLLVSIAGQLNIEDAEEIKRRFSGGPAQAGQTTVVEADDISVADLSASPRDVQWQEAVRGSKEDIMLAFGVPESIMGNASGRTFDNADAEYEDFWVHTMIPHCDAIAGGLDVLTGANNDDTVIAYDYKVIDVLQRHKRARDADAIQMYENNAITWNEMRRRIGEDPWDDALAANIIVDTSGFAFAKDPNDQAKIMALPNVNTIGPPAAGAGSTPFPSRPITGPGQQARQIGAAAQAGAQRGAAIGSRNLNDQISARALQLVGKQALRSGMEQKDIPPAEDIVDAEVVLPEHPYMQQRLQVEASLDGLLIGMSSRQESVLTDRLMHAKVRKGTRHWEGETKGAKSLDPAYVVETDRWAKDMRDDFAKVLKPVMLKEANRVARDMQSSGLLDMLDGEGALNADQKTALGRLIGNKADVSHFIDQKMSEVLDIVEASTRNQSHRIATKIKTLDDEGKSLDDIKSEVRRIIGTRSSWRKGLTGHCTTSAIESIKEAVYANGGDHVEKTWNTEGDERVRSSHAFVDGETKAVDEGFNVGSTVMMFPGDPLAPVEEVANCRCFLSYHLDS